jgi:aspartyl/asparaginyl beta-hydroxylase (cupin superfamily)
MKIISRIYVYMYMYIYIYIYIKERIHVFKNRCHLPLVIPEGDCGMEIGGKTVKWEVGKPLFFDDCYEHKGTFKFY